MSKTIAIHQPNYIPWLGYFYKIYQSDIFVFLDDAQFSNQGMQNYHYIKTPQGSYRLKIPVKGKFGDLIKEIKTRDELGWKKKHLKSIEMNYKKSKYFEEIFPGYSSLILDEYDGLADLNISIIIHICKKFGIQTDFALSSKIGLNSKREQKVLDICSTLNGTIYYSGTGAKAYQKEENFKECGIELRYSEYFPFEYPQLWGDFQSNVSVIDYLMNCGYNWEQVLENQEKTIR
jgi:hypothetical protein